MTSVTCPICLDPARVPVRFICFPCPAEIGRPSCHSVTRVCLLCARDYLELNLPRHQRVHTRKCLTCNAVCHPSTLNATSAYEKDYLLMSLNTTSRFTCPQCPYEGTHHELDRHYGTTCPERYQYCQSCRCSFKASDEQHKERCPSYAKCIECDQFIHLGEIYDHYLIYHQMEYCGLCAVWYKVDLHHRTICPRRFVECRDCRKYVRHLERQSHIERHIQEHKDRIQELHHALLLEEMKLEENQSTSLDLLFKEK